MANLDFSGLNFDLGDYEEDPLAKFMNPAAADPMAAAPQPFEAPLAAPFASNPNRVAKLNEIDQAMNELRQVQAGQVKDASSREGMTANQLLVTAIAGILPMVMGRMAAGNAGGALGGQAGANIAQGTFANWEKGGADRRAESLAESKLTAEQIKDLVNRRADLEKQGFAAEDSIKAAGVRNAQADSVLDRKQDFSRSMYEVKQGDNQQTLARKQEFAREMKALDDQYRTAAREDSQQYQLGRDDTRYDYTTGRDARQNEFKAKQQDLMFRFRDLAREDSQQYQLGRDDTRYARAEEDAERKETFEREMVRLKDQYGDANSEVEFERRKTIAGIYAMNSKTSKENDPETAIEISKTLGVPLAVAKDTAAVSLLLRGREQAETQAQNDKKDIRSSRLETTAVQGEFNKIIGKSRDQLKALNALKLLMKNPDSVTTGAVSTALPRIHGEVGNLAIQEQKKALPTSLKGDLVGAWNYVTGDTATTINDAQAKAINKYIIEREAVIRDNLENGRNEVRARAGQLAPGLAERGELDKVLSSLALEDSPSGGSMPNEKDYDTGPEGRRQFLADLKAYNAGQ